MARFRDTAWFKIGAADLDPPPERPSQPALPVRPMEERYLDDDTLTTEDSAMFSLRTGTTQPIARRLDVEGPAEVGHLVDDLKRGRGPMLAVIGAAMLAVVVLLVVI